VIDGGNLQHGFARVKCKDCGHEYLLAFVLKRSGNPALAGQAPPLLPILPSEARSGIRGAAVQDVLKKIPHRHFVFSNRKYFVGTSCMIENFLPPSAAAPGNP